MAGSLKDFKYTTGDGRNFAVKMDESNGEAVGNADMLLADEGDLDRLPRNIEPRYAIYRSLDGRVTRKVIITNPAANITTLPTSFDVSSIDGNPAVAVILTSFKGENQSRIPTARDTGLDDADAT